MFPIAMPEGAKSMTVRRSIPRWLHSHRDQALDLVRVYLGIGLFAKGVLFASDPELIPSLLRDGTSFAATPAMVAHYVVAAHLAGGALLTLGLFTRIAALVQIPALLGAVFIVHVNEGLFSRDQNQAFALLVLFLLGLFVVSGGGRWSLDHYVRSLLKQTDFDVDVDEHPRRA